MKRRQVEPAVESIHVWSHEEACRLLPYIASIVRSLREHRLDAQRYRLAAERLQAKPGRPDRNALIEESEALGEARAAEERFEDALHELHALDIYSLDPIRGQALVPFAHGQDLAWYVFDLFEDDKLRSWRFHSDPLDMRRPVEELAGLATAA
jgi:hypothetical protein